MSVLRQIFPASIIRLIDSSSFGRKFVSAIKQMSPIAYIPIVLTSGERSPFLRTRNKISID